MKKFLFILLILCTQIFPQSRFAIETDGGIDLISSTEFSTGNTENGYSITVSPVYYFNDYISLLGILAFHRAEGGLSSPIALDNNGYSIDNPYKPNIYTYEIGLGFRANFSDKIVKPYFVIRTGLLFTNVPYYSYGFYTPVQQPDHRIAMYISPGLGVNFNLTHHFIFLVEARFNITTGTDYSFAPITTGIQYRF